VADGEVGTCLTTVEVKAVARLAKLVEQHYGRPQDIEWAIDATGAIVLLQARPETVWRNAAPAAPTTALQRIAAGLRSSA
jgi:pyruvate,water dikinase